MTDGEFGLTFGSLDWSPAAQVDDVTVDVLGLVRGRPVPVTEVVQSLLQDGARERRVRDDNRDQQVILAINAADSTALAEYEATLVAEVHAERNELTWTPPDGFGYPTVFDVEWADLAMFEGDGWDLDELRGKRLWTVTFRCQPYGRSVDEVEVTATPTAASPTLLDGGTATTNWSSPDSTLATSTVGGRTVVGFTPTAPTFGVTIRYNGTYPTDPYVSITLLDDAFTSVLLDFAAPVSVDTDGVWSTYYFANRGGVAPLEFIATRGTASTAPVYVDKLEEADGIGFASLVAVEVFGSVRTTGRYVVTRASGMRWVTMFSDPAMTMGAYHPAVPATYANAPEGTYAFWMDPRAGLLEVTVTDAAGQSQPLTTNGQWTNPVNGDVHPDLVPVGELTLGGTYDGLVGALTFEVKVDGIVVADPSEYRLFRKDRDTSLTHVLLSDAGGTGGDVLELVVESPSVARPFGGVWADGVSVIGKTVAWQDPAFAPQWTYLFVEANDSAADPVETVAAYYPRHHTHATR